MNNEIVLCEKHHYPLHETIEGELLCDKCIIELRNSSLVYRFNEGLGTELYLETSPKR